MFVPCQSASFYLGDSYDAETDEGCFEPDPPQGVPDFATAEALDAVEQYLYGVEDGL